MLCRRSAMDNPTSTQHRLCFTIANIDFQKLQVCDRPGERSNTASPSNFQSRWTTCRLVQVLSASRSRLVGRKRASGAVSRQAVCFPLNMCQHYLTVPSVASLIAAGHLASSRSIVTRV